MRDGAGSSTAARFERVLTTSRGVPSGAGSRMPTSRGGLRCQRHEPVPADDLDQLGRSPGAGMLVERLPAGDGERVGEDRLDADLIAAGLHRLLDIAGDTRLQLGEELVLLGDGERQQPVEELRHGRQVVLEPALMSDLEAGRLLEAFRVPALDAPAPERAVELPEGRLGIVGFEIVALAEQRERRCRPWRSGCPAGRG